MNPIKFEDYKELITDTIQAKLQTGLIAGEDGFTLVKGFIMQPLSPLSKEVSGNLEIDESTIPLVAMVGNTSGRMYYFALKALLPDLNI